MPDKPQFDHPQPDRAAAHRYFSAACFNATWQLLDEPDRTPDDDRRMLATAWASLYHWLEREDCSPENLSIGYWQISRVYAVLRVPREALRWADVCVAYSADLNVFLRGYAQEALARAAQLAGERDRAERALRAAQELAAQVEDAADGELLRADLRQLAAG